MSNDQVPMTNQTANGNDQDRQASSWRLGHCFLIGHWGLVIGHFAAPEMGSRA
jgi:hypothetical protein